MVAGAAIALLNQARMHSDAQLLETLYAFGDARVMKSVSGKMLGIKYI
ncbi:hypothetical protein [Nostoc sp.]